MCKAVGGQKEEIRAKLRQITARKSSNGGWELNILI